MNKLLIELNEITTDFNDAVIYELENKKIKINVKKDTSLELDFRNNENKYEILINVDKYINLDLSIYNNGIASGITYTFNISENSNVNIKKLNDVDRIDELVYINLNGYKANISYEFTTISKNSEKYSYAINHNASETVSNIINKGVNINDGELVFDINSYVLNEINDCILNQNSRIVNLTNNKCQINPNLFIDENDVEANHSAHIGKFSDEELFYMQSRGIDYATAHYLLVTGILMHGNEIFKEKIEELIEKYWR